MAAAPLRSDGRRSVVTLVLWSAGFVAVVAVAAWQFGWLPTDEEAAHVPPVDGEAELSGGSAVPFAPLEDAAGGTHAEWRGGSGQETLAQGRGQETRAQRSGVAAAGGPARLPAQHEPASAPNPNNEQTWREDSRRARLWDHVREAPADHDPWSPADAAPTYSAAAEPAGWLAQDAPAQRATAGPAGGLTADSRHIPAEAPAQGQVRYGDVRPAAYDEVQPARAEHSGRGPGAAAPKIRLAGVEAIDTGPATTQGAAAGRAPSSSLAADAPLSPAHPAAAEIAEIDGLLAAGDIKEAHRRLSTLYWQQPAWRALIQKRIDQTAESIYFSGLRHFMEPYVVEAGDQLARIATRYKVSWQYLERLNGVPATRIRPGQRLKVIKGPFAARIDLSDFELTVHAHGWYVRRYRVGIGRDGSTPIGKFAVQEKLVNPTYYRPPAEGGGIVAADDPSNPLGEYWIGIGNSYGLHGTVDPQSIGGAESRGCIRLLNEDMAEVFELLVPGAEVVIQP